MDLCPFSVTGKKIIVLNCHSLLAVASVSSVTGCGEHLGDATGSSSRLPAVVSVGAG